MGLGRTTVPVPGAIARRLIRSMAGKLAGAVAALGDDDRRVHRFVVAELARTGARVEPARVAEALRLDPARVGEILAGLERRLIYLVRDADGRVEWAYPFTAADTPYLVQRPGQPPLHGA